MHISQEYHYVYVQAPFHIAELQSEIGHRATISDQFYVMIRAIKKQIIQFGGFDYQKYTF